MNHDFQQHQDIHNQQQQQQQPIPVAVTTGWISNSSPSSTPGGSVQYQSASNTPSPPVAVSVGCMGAAQHSPIGIPFYPVLIPGESLA